MPKAVEVMVRSDDGTVLRWEDDDAQNTAALIQIAREAVEAVLPSPAASQARWVEPTRTKPLRKVTEVDVDDALVLDTEGQTPVLLGSTLLPDGLGRDAFALMGRQTRITVEVTPVDAKE